MISWRRYVDMMLFMTDRPTTAADLVSQFGHDHGTMRDFIRMMLWVRMVRIVSWDIHPGGGNIATAVVVRGAGENVPPAPWARVSYAAKRPTKHALTFAVMWKAIEAAPQSAFALVDASGADLNRVYELLTYLRSRRAIRLVDVVPSNPGKGGKPTTCWQLCGLDEGPAVRDAAVRRYERLHAHPFIMAQA